MQLILIFGSIILVIKFMIESGKEEEEIEIGNPTDVKHVAHIGWDGPSSTPASAPSWVSTLPTMHA